MKSLTMMALTAAGVFGFEWIRRQFGWSDWFTLGFLGFCTVLQGIQYAQKTEGGEQLCFRV
jgi:hypothetical protein